MTPKTLIVQGVFIISQRYYYNLFLVESPYLHLRIFAHICEDYENKHPSLNVETDQATSLNILYSSQNLS